MPIWNDLRRPDRRDCKLTRTGWEAAWAESAGNFNIVSARPDRDRVPIDQLAIVFGRLRRGGVCPTWSHRPAAARAFSAGRFEPPGQVDALGIAGSVDLRTATVKR
jgi:hypothetical protein